MDHNDLNVLIFSGHPVLQTEHKTIKKPQAQTIERETTDLRQQLKAVEKLNKQVQWN